MNKPDEETLARLRVRIHELLGLPGEKEMWEYEVVVFGQGPRYTVKEQSDWWTYVDRRDNFTTFKAGPATKVMVPDPEMPDYTGELNAVHEAEKLLTPTAEEADFQEGNWMTFLQHLYAVTELNKHRDPPWKMVHAEAWERCVALDRTLSKEPIV